MLEALITLQGLRHLYATDGIELEVNTKKVIIIMTVTIFMPIFILKESQGAIEAVVSSVKVIKPHLLWVMFLVFSMWIVMLLNSALIEAATHLFFPKTISGLITELISYVIGLFYLVFIKTLFENFVQQQDVVPAN